MTRLSAYSFVLLVCLTLPSLWSQTPVVLRGPYLQKGTSTAITVCWRTDILSDSIVHYGGSPGALTNTVSNSALAIDHKVTLSGLTPDSEVFYAIASTSSGTLAGADSDHVFRTPPATGTAKPTRVWVLGDSGTADANARAVRDSYYNYVGDRGTDLMILLGDNAYLDGTDLQYQYAMFENMYEAILKKTVVWPTLGNHDALSSDGATESGPYFDIFDLPANGEAGGLASGTEAYYSFDRGDIHFVVLDSQTLDRTVSGAMATWLQADLAANTLTWTIAFWHHPPYSKGSHDSDTGIESTDMRQVFLPILENAGVDLVLSAHSHAYERSFLVSGHYGLSSTFDPALHTVSGLDGRIGLGGGYRKEITAMGSLDGTVYVVSGASGSLGIGSGTLDHPTSLVTIPLLGSLVLDIRENQLDARYIGHTGVLADFFSIVKNGVTPVQTSHLPVLQQQSWRFEDSGTDLGTSWIQPNFDDSSWSLGMAPLGFGAPNLNTIVSSGNNPNQVNPTTYLRRTFFVDLKTSEIDLFEAAVLFDDGYVMYLNGTEVARSDSMPGGTPTYTTLAMNHEADVLERVDLNASIPLLQQGLNTLAIEVHQDGPMSPDLFFDGGIYIEGARSSLAPEAAGTVLNSTGEAESLFFINGSDGGFGRSVDVRINEPFSFEIKEPSLPNGSSGAPFTLFGYTGTPRPEDVYSLPAGVGSMVFPPAILGVHAPLSFLVGDTLLGLPGAIAFTSPAPWFATNPGIGFPGVYTFHGFILTGPGMAQTFNAIRFRILN